MVLNREFNCACLLLLIFVPSAVFPIQTINSKWRNPEPDCQTSKYEYSSSSDLTNFVDPASTSTQIPVSQLLIVGSDKFGDSSRLSPLFPCWFDPGLARQGQKFAQKNMAPIFSGHFLALVMLLGNEQVRRVMYATRRSENPQKAFKRYTSTAMQIKLWYDTDILNPDWLKSLKTLRRIHKGIGIYLKSLKNHTDFSSPLLKSGNNPSGFWPTQTIWQAFRSDLDNSRLNQTSRIKLQRLGRAPKELYNQFLMTLTQWSFVGMPVIFPGELGIPQWTEEDLKGFIHLWAVITYILGAEEDFIICKDYEDLEGCKGYLKGIFEEYMVPPLFYVDFEGQVMIESILRSPQPLMVIAQPDFALVQLFEDILKIPAPALNAQSTWQTRVARFLVKYFGRPILNWTPIHHIINFFIDGEMQVASERTFGDPGTNSTAVAQSFFYLE